MSYLQIDMRRTGEKIKKLCKEKKVTVKDIQKELNIGAFQSIYDWFSGKSLPSLDNFFCLSRLLKVHMEDMIEVVPAPVTVSISWETGSKNSRNYLFAYFEKLSEYRSAIQLQTE